MNFYECCDLTKKVYLLLIYYLYLFNYRRRGSGVQFELKKELSRMTQGPQTQKVASRVNRVQKWMKVLNSINNPPRKLNDIIHMQSKYSLQEVLL